MERDERRLTLSEAAEALGISTVTARRWIKSGKLRAYQPGRSYQVPVKEVEALLEPGPWDVPPEGAGPKAPRPAPRSLLEGSGTETASSALPRREWLDATGGTTEEEKARNLVAVGEETLSEQLAVYPYLLSGNRDGLGQPTILREYEDVVMEFLFRRLLLSTGLERMLEETGAQSEHYRKARALLSKLRAFESLIPQPADEAYRRSRDEAERYFESVA